MNRAKILVLLLLPALDVYAFLWVQQTDDWAARRWALELLALEIVGATLLLTELLHRATAGLAKWTAGLVFACSLLMAPVLALPFIGMRWGGPQVFPNTRAFSKYQSLPEHGQRLDLAFREVRLVLYRYGSIMQGINRLLTVVGTPHESWFRTFQANRSAGPRTPEAGCALHNPSGWTRRDCPGTDAELCFYCTYGREPDTKSNVVFFSADGKRAAFYSGTGPFLDLAMKDARALARDRSAAPYPYSPDTASLDPAHAAYYARVASTGPVPGGSAPADASVLRDCMSRGDQDCLTLLRRTDPSGEFLRQIMRGGDEYERLGAASALARYRDPEALVLLLQQLRRLVKTSKNRADFFGLAEALSEYGTEAASAVPDLIDLADKTGAPGPAVLRPELIAPMIRIGTPQAFAYVGRCCEGPVRLETAQTVAKAFEELKPPSQAATAELDRWISLQSQVRGRNAYPLIQTLRTAAGDAAARRHLPYVREMAPEVNSWNDWGTLRHSLERPR